MQTTLTSQAIDDVLAGTFPASDPPAWTPGMARPAPEVWTPADAPADVIDVSRPAGSERTFARNLASLFGAAGVALLLPVVVLAVGTPVALALRGLLKAAQWLVAMIR